MFSTPRLVLLAALIAAPAAGWAEMITVGSQHAAESTAEPSQHPVVVRGRVEGADGGIYAGFVAASAHPDNARDLDLTLGIRPRIWSADLDLSYTQRLVTPGQGRLALSLDRPIGTRGDLGARIYFDQVSDRAGAEARAAVTVFRGTRIDGGVAAHDALADTRIGLDVGVQQRLAELCRFDVRYRDAVLAPARAEMNLRLDF